MCIMYTHYVAQCWEQVSAQFGITLIVKVGLEEGKIFDFHMPLHDTFVLRKL